MEEICFEQMLYGYDGGHRLLATSFSKRLRQQRVVDVLSDASGEGSFEEYLTAFPLVEDGYYALAKTWYAEEMPRPGCVWTHILLFPLEQSGKIAGSGNILGAFRRPKGSGDVTGFSDRLFLQQEVRRHTYKHFLYVLYTFFSSNQKVLVSDENGSEYEEALVAVLTRLPAELLIKFSVCTRSLSVRYLEREAFTYQITSDRRKRMFFGEIKDAVRYKGDQGDQDYPLWTQFLNTAFQQERQKEIFDFCHLYGEIDRLMLREFSKILYAMGATKEKKNIEIYLNMLKKVDHGDKYITKTLTVVYFKPKNKFDEMFTKDSVIQYLVKNIRNDNAADIFLQKILDEKKTDKYTKYIYQSGKDVLERELFANYISGILNENGRKLICSLVQLLQAGDLKDVFQMDRSSCIVLVQMKPSLAQCSEIWKMSRDFQMEIIEYIDTGRLEKQERLNICRAMVRISVENICRCVEDVFGEDITEAVCDELEKDQGRNIVDLTEWLPTVFGDRDKYLQILSSLNSPRLLEAFMKTVDSYQIADDEEQQIWMRVIQRNRQHIRETDEYRHILFVFPFIVKNQSEDEEMTDWVFEKLHSKLETSSVAYEDWRKIEPFLPSVNMEQSWDKCLRLRLAFGREG